MVDTKGVPSRAESIRAANVLQARDHCLWQTRSNHQPIVSGTGLIGATTRGAAFGIWGDPENERRFNERSRDPNKQGFLRTPRWFVGARGGCCGMKEAAYAAASGGCALALWMKSAARCAWAAAVKTARLSLFRTSSQLAM